MTSNDKGNKEKEIIKKEPKRNSEVKNTVDELKKYNREHHQQNGSSRRKILRIRR